MIEKIVNEIDLSCFQEELINLLEYEKQIDQKKKNNEKLTRDEYFFDTYLIKPSSICRVLFERSKKNEKS